MTWRRFPLKRLVEINRAALPEATPPDTEFRYLDIAACGRGILVAEPEPTTFGDAPSRARRQVRPDDTIVSTVRTYLRAVWPISGPTEDLVVSTGFAVLSPNNLIDPRFLGWLVQSDVVIEEIVARSVGVSYPGINGLEIGEIVVRIPDVEEQHAIADYLNAETAHMDSLVGKYRRLTENQLEKRLAVIAAGVAGEWVGSRRRRSRLPWLESVPHHWDEVKLTLLAKLGSGHTPSRDHPEWWADCTIPWITTGEVWQLRDDRVEHLHETREMISPLGLANSAAELHPAGTVVLSRTASAGFSAIMGRDMATSQDYVTWTCGPRLRPRYLLLCLRAMRPDLLGRLAMGSTHKTIYVPDIQSIRVPVPPLAEQDRLVDAVWERLRALDRSVDAVNLQIELLQERRQTLVTAAVSGQLEIAGVAA